MAKLIVWILTAALIAGLGLAASANEAPTPAQIAAALAEQEAANIDVRYSSGAGDPPSLRVRYVRTADVLYREDRREKGRPSVTKCSYEVNKNQTRLLTTTNEGDCLGWVLDDLRSPLDQQDIVETARFILPSATASPHSTLRYWVGRGQVAPQPEDIDGRRCWRVQVPDPIAAASKYVMLLDPAIGFCPRRIQIYWKELGLQTYRFEDYSQIRTGIWFPMRLAADFPGETGPSAGLIRKVDQIKCPDAISADELLVQFPPGTDIRTYR